VKLVIKEEEEENDKILTC